MESPGRGEHSEPGGTAWGCGSGGGARPGLPMGSTTSRWSPEPSRSIRMKSTSRGSPVVVASISPSSRRPWTEWSVPAWPSRWADWAGSPSSTWKASSPATPTRTWCSTIVSANQEEATKIIQGIYGEPIKEDLIHRRISEIKKGGSAVAVSSIPQRAERFAQIAQEAGADVFIVQSTVTTARHFATEYTPVDLRKLKKQLAIPLIIGNVVTYEACLELMDCGADALLIGVGPGAACTSREVLGLGVPQVTATADAAAARDYHYKQRGRYVPIITDGGMTTGGDVCKALAAGADAVMIGSAFARAHEAPGRGYHWGMATPHANLPRGTRIRVGVAGSLEQILFGPAFTEDGTLNLVGAIRTCMGSVGARTIRELQQTELIIAPTIKTEGKIFQQAQKLGRPR